MNEFKLVFWIREGMGCQMVDTLKNGVAVKIETNSRYPLMALFS